MLDIINESAETLEEKVKSLNGTTESALKYFKSRNLQEDIVYETMEKSKMLSK
jgi:pyrroline-5-carboxylate reductase